MAQTVAAMGGDGVDYRTAEAASALGWWLESGVDALVQERPRNWLDTSPPPAPAEETLTRPPLPADLEAFRAWLSGASDAPLAAKGSRPILPEGAEEAEVMLLAEPPGREDSAAGRPIGGAAWELATRMLASVGLSAEQAYVANIACFYSPGAKLSPEQLSDCGEAARRHVALARPRRLLLLGDAAARALLGKPLVEARGHTHVVEGVRTIATFHPRFLLSRPSEKARAWNDLLLLMEEPS